MAWYGGWDGPTSNTRFRACMDMRTSTQNETQGYVQIRRWVEATGSFAGTILDTSWADKVTLYNGIILEPVVHSSGSFTKPKF